jgi:cell division protein FtsB
MASGSTSKTPARQSIKATRQLSKERFTKQDIEATLTFLEHPPNFASIFGSGGQTTISKPTKSSNQAYATLAQIVSKQNDSEEESSDLEPFDTQSDIGTIALSCIQLDW